MRLLQYVYRLYYASGTNSLALRAYKKIMRSPKVTRWLFGMKVLPENELKPYFDKPPIYFNLTTILLRDVIKAKLRRAPEARLLEIGIGAFAVLSGHLTRFAREPIDAVDIDEQCIEVAKKHIEWNQVPVRAYCSDLFSALPGRKYDLVFWNLPYDADPAGYLPGLFEQTHNFLNPGGQLVIIYNTKYFPRVYVLDLLTKTDRLRFHEAKTWWWNIHEAIAIVAK